MLKPDYLLTSKCFVAALLSALSLIGWAESAANVINYPDGSQYKGQLFKQSREGKGSLQYANGDHYQGDWKADRPHGQGVKIFADGSRYRGGFVAGQQQGNGTLEFADGTRYQGEWFKNNPHGQGQFTFSNGETYKGNVSYGLPHGKGSFKYANGDHYYGQWQRGKRIGNGKLSYQNGSWYQGQFTEGVAEGKGELHFANGDLFRGNFLAGKPQGEGNCVVKSVKAICSYDNGERIAFALIPRHGKKYNKKYKKKHSNPKRIAKAIPKLDKPGLKAAASHAALTSATLATHNASFKQQLASAKQTLKATKTFTSADLAQGKSDILFTHNFAELQLSDSQRTGWWQLKPSLFNDQLRLQTRSGKLELDITLNHFRGPGSYALTAKNLQARFHNKSLTAAKQGNEPAGILIIEKIKDKWLLGTLELNLVKPLSPEQSYQIKNGIFRLSSKSSQPPPTKGKGVLDSIF